MISKKLQSEQSMDQWALCQVMETQFAMTLDTLFSPFYFLISTL